MHKDYEGRLIGAGEDTALAILKFAFNLEELETKDFPAHGIYRQIPVMKLLKPEIVKEINFSEEFKKHTVDIVVSTANQIIAIYVNGTDHNGTLKSFRDCVKYDYLSMSKIKKMILRKSECRELFKERQNYKSILEVCNGLDVAGVKP